MNGSKAIDRHLKLSLLLALLFLCGGAFGHASAASELTFFQMQSQPLPAALREFARQSGMQVAIQSELADAKTAPRLAGQYQPAAALAELLKDTGLVAYPLNENTYGIRPINASAGSVTERRRPANIMRLAQADVAAAQAQSEATAPQAANPAATSVIHEVIVTARKRQENLQDISMSITALDGAEIAQRGLLSLGDYLNAVPSVLIRESGIGFNSISIRGIAGSGDSGDATVGNYFGEIPLTLGASNRTVDLKLVDMQRIEVLRGPQGTLYGASSLGGAVRKIPNPPAPGQFASTVALSYANTAENGGDSNSANAMVNVPLVGDSLALRVVGYRYDNSGYIVNDGAADPVKVALAQQYGATLVEDDDVNSHLYSGYRASLLWQPTRRFSATLMHIDQDLESDGHAEVDPRLPPYTIATFGLGNVTRTGRESFEDDHQLTNLVLDYDLGAGVLTSSSSWLSGQFTWTRDNSRFLAGPVAIRSAERMSGYVQEVRFSSRFDGPWQAIGGLYYENLENDRVQGMSWVGNPDLMPPGLFGGDPSPNAIFRANNQLEVKQKAVFGELSYQLTSRLELTAGGRWFDYDRRQDNDVRGEWLAPSDFHESASESGSRYKFNASYRFDDDALVYAQWAEGFRLGSPQQPAPASACDINNDGILDGTNAPVNPGDLRSDSLDSYELGGKLTLFEQRLVVNAALFYINWTDIPTVSPNGTCGFNVALNAAEAVSQGVELESRWRITPALQFRASGSYIDAEFASEDRAAGARKGERLPGTAQYNALVGLQYDFDLAGNPSYVRGDYGYIGKFYRTVDEQRRDLARSGDYGKLDVRLGVTLERFDLELFARNLTNVNGYTGAQSTFRAYQLTPRVVGVNASCRF